MQAAVHPVDRRSQNDGEEGGDEEQRFDSHKRPHEEQHDERGQHHADGDGDRADRYRMRLLEHGQIVRLGSAAVALWSPLPWARPSPSPRSEVSASTSSASSSTAASRGWDTSAIAPTRRSWATVRPTSWPVVCSPTAAWRPCTSTPTSSPSTWPP